ncbi:MAG TPA: MarR family transcriptional regulator [Nocardioidaceae bacterium]|nr:MarR family transcriptional regulator [Nocardioidaceae bacterium]
MASDPAPQPLTPLEDEAWRGLIRLMVAMPRAIDEDLLRRGGLSLTRYVVLMRLSEAPDQGLRMSDLAQAASISPSRMTRIVQSMTAEGLVARQVVAGDGRASLATLTDAGMQRLRDAWPQHLAGVRALVLDHINADDLVVLTRVTRQVLGAIGDARDGQADDLCPAGLA